MRDIFHGYYSLSQEEIKEFWESCVFVFDANVLLDLFRLSRKSTDRLLDIMEAQKERIWLPYQVAEEYHRNLSATISEQAKRCEKTIELLAKLLEELGVKKNQSFLDSIHKEASEHLKELEEKLKAKRESTQKLLHENPNKDRIASIFKGKIGEEISSEKRTERCKEAQKRYDEKIPPGFCDAKSKSEPECYGDYLVWCELIEYSQKEKKHILFVSGDVKEDWVCQARGQHIGPHPDLRREFRKKTSKTYYSYTLDSFLEEYSRIIEDKSNNPEDEEVIREIREREDEPESMSSHSTLGETTSNNESKIELTDSNSIC